MANLDPNHMDARALAAFRAIEAELGKPLTVTSGYRDQAYNRKVGGARKSRHMAGDALDIRVPDGMTHEEFRAIAEKHGFTGFGKYSKDHGGHIHIDMGPQRQWAKGAEWGAVGGPSQQTPRPPVRNASMTGGAGDMQVLGQAANDDLAKRAKPADGWLSIPAPGRADEKIDPASVRPEGGWLAMPPPGAAPATTTAEKNAPAPRPPRDPRYHYGLTDELLPFSDEVAAAGMSVGQYLGGQDMPDIEGAQVAPGADIDAFLRDGPPSPFERNRAAFADEKRQYREDNPGRSMVAGAIGGLAAAPAKAVATVGSVVPAARSVPGNLARAAGVGAAVSGLYGADEGDSPGERAVNAATAAPIGAVLGPVGYALMAGGAKVMRALTPYLRRGQVFNPATGRLTAEALEALRAAGVKAEDITADVAKAFDEMAVKAGVAPDTARQSLADEFGIRLTRGTATDDFTQIAREEGMRSGTYGPGAQRTMQAGDQARTEAIGSARERIANDMGDGPPVGDELAAGELAREAVRTRATEAKRGAQRLYRAADNAGAELDPAAVPALVKGVEARLAGGGREPPIMITSDTPQARTALRAIKGVADFVKKKQANASGRIDGTHFQLFETTRSLVAKAAREAKGVDEVATQRIMQGFDDWFDDAMTHGLYSGDPAVLETLKTARAAWARYRNTFGPGGKFSDEGKIIDRMIEQDVTATEVANWLYGASKVGISGRSVRLARRMKTILGPDSPEWAAVRQGAWLQATGAAGKSPGPQAMAQSITDMVEGRGGALSRELFTEAERKEMMRFAGVLKLLVPPPRATNPSGTSAALVRFARDWFAGIMGAATGGPAGAIVGKVGADAGSNFSGSLAAARAAKPIQRTAPVFPGAAAGAGGAQGYSIDDAMNAARAR